jgi:hypothetical protein
MIGLAARHDVTADEVSCSADRPGEGRADIGLREVVTDVEQRDTMRLRTGVGEAVTEVQAGRMTALAVRGVCRDGESCLRSRNRDPGDTGGVQKIIHALLSDSGWDGLEPGDGKRRLVDCDTACEPYGTVA